MERRIVNTNIRLNLVREEDRRAYEHLRSMDRKKYRSYRKRCRLNMLVYRGYSSSILNYGW